MPNWDHNGGSVTFIIRSDTPDTNSDDDHQNNDFLMCQAGLDDA